MSNSIKGIHVAIIPDGNRRWARKNNLSVLEGYRIVGERTLPHLLDSFEELHICTCTLWILSPENFNRPKAEVTYILNLIEKFLDEKEALLHKKKIRFMTIGSSRHLNKSLCAKIDRLSESTKQYSNKTLCCAIDYGGREEIVRALERIQNNFKQISKYSVDLISHFLDTAELGDPDLIIRTGGEKRLSGFMLWQSEYSELYFTDTLFPDFTKRELALAIKEFYKRERRYGK